MLRGKNKDRLCEQKEGKDREMRWKKTKDGTKLKSKFRGTNQKLSQSVFFFQRKQVNYLGI
jgi:hypothetical protein